MDPEQYSNELNQTYEVIQTSKNLPERFCKFVAEIEKSIPESYSPEILAKVKDSFYDINKRIEEYDDQFQLLVKELGVVCRNDPSLTSVPQRFFQGMLDFFKLAFSLYNNEPEKLQVFSNLLGKVKEALSSGNMTFGNDLFERALLLQLTKSAWVLSNPSTSMNQAAKHIGGSLKNKTRKQKRKA
jgi:hypothetical protein